MPDVEIRVEAEDAASATLDQIAGKLDQVAVAAGETSTQASTAGTAIGASMEKGQKGAESLLASFGELRSGMMEAAGLWGAKEAIEGILRFGEAGAELINVANGFDRITEAAGLNSRVVESSFAAAADGVVMTDDLLKEFNLTANATGAEIATSFPSLIEGAMAIAAQGIGETMSNLQLMDSYIRTGFGRGIKMQLGLVLPDQPAIMDAYAASLGKTTSQLTELDQAQARAQAVTDALKGKYGDLDEASRRLAGGGILQLKNAWHELIEELQKEAAPTIDRVAGGIAAWIRAGTAGTAEFNDRKMEELRNASGQYSYILPGIQDPATKGKTDYQQWVESINAATLSEAQFNEALTLLSERAPEAATELVHARAAAEDLTRQNELLATSATHTGLTLGDIGRQAANTAVLERYYDAWRNIVDEFRAFINIGDITGQLGKINDAVAAYDKAINGGGPPSQADYANTPAGRLEYGADMITYFTDKYVDGVSQQKSAETDFDNQRKQNWETLQGKMESYFSTYNSAIAGLLTPTATGPTGDQMMAATGQSGDSWDESNKRAKAVFMDYGNTAKQAWFAGWAEKVGFPTGASNDEARAWAANYSKQFEMFQRPQDIDWEALRKQFGDLVDTQLGKQQVMDTLKGQLGAGGLGPDNPSVMQAFDFAGLGETGGSDMASTFMASFTSANWAGAGQGIVSKIAAGASTGNQALMGALAGDLWPYIKPLVEEDAKHR